MPGLPKIVFARLRAKSAAAGSSRAAAGPGSSQEVEHLDANLLGAFLEKTLTESERTLVLNHLAQCAECREQAALALPAEIAGAQPVARPAQRAGSAWLTLRRGVLAAALGALIIAVVVQQYPWRRQETLPRELHPSAPAGAKPGPPQASPESPLAQPSPGGATAQGGRESAGSARQMARLEKGAGRAGGQPSAAHLARPEASTSPSERLMTEARPPVAPGPENVSRVRAARAMSRNASALALGAMPTATPPAKLAFQPSAAPESEAKAEISAAPQAGPLESKPGTPAALWTISASGKVQRSEDGGKTWKDVPVDDSVTYRVITASGRDVWAGGSGGALDHSNDGGVTWQRVNLNSGGNSVTEPIASIRLRDLQHLTVTTASGEQWVTQDGGQSWQREP